MNIPDDPNFASLGYPRDYSAPPTKRWIRDKSGLVHFVEAIGPGGYVAIPCGFRTNPDNGRYVEDATPVTCAKCVGALFRFQRDCRAGSCGQPPTFTVNEVPVCAHHIASFVSLYAPASVLVARRA